MRNETSNQTREMNAEESSPAIWGESGLVGCLCESEHLGNAVGIGRVRGDIVVLSGILIDPAHHATSQNIT